MYNLQRFGAVAAVANACIFIFGFAVYFSLLIPARYGSLSVDPVAHAAFLAKNQSTMYAFNLVIYVVFGVLLVVLALALHERLQDRATALMRTATAFALVWATLVIASGMIANIGATMVTGLYGTSPHHAATTWLSLSMVVNGMGGGNEVVGGMWVLLVCAAVLQTDALPKPLAYLGVLVSVAGLVTTIPPLKELGAVFGMGLIVWFAWLGVALLAPRQRTEVHASAA
jgi:Domain of unknown function (DUF4386)